MLAETQSSFDFHNFCPKITAQTDSLNRLQRQLYGSLSELLRHFWSCFVPTPPTTPAMQEKAVKTFETLNKFQHVKLRPFENELVG
jgi:hypothetical protein